MAARRCATCGINYPPMHSTCPVHDTTTEYVPGLEADDDWQWRATVLLQRMKTGGHVDEDGILLLTVPITVSPNGYHWISSWDVISEGVQHRFPSDEVIAVGPSTATRKDEPDENLYEVIAYVDERRAYWIRPLLVPDFPPDE